LFSQRQQHLSDLSPGLGLSTNDVWRHVTPLAERYRRELSGLAKYVNGSLKVFEKLKKTAVGLLFCLAERDVPAIDIEALEALERSGSKEWPESNLEH
jgi:hypothetical protein